MKYDSLKLSSDFSQRLFLLTLLAMIIAAVLSIVISLMEFNNGLKPFVVEKVEAVVEAVGQDINYAIEVGVPFDQIRGLDDYISNLISDHPEIEQIKVIRTSDKAANDVKKILEDSQVSGDSAGSGYIDKVIDTMSEVAFTLSGRNSSYDLISLEIVLNGAAIATVEAVVDEDYVNGKMINVFYDTFVILVCVLLVALEVVVVLSHSQMVEPFRLLENALKERAKGNLCQYNLGRAKGRFRSFISKMNEQNAKLREACELSFIRFSSALENTKATKKIKENSISVLESVHEEFKLKYKLNNIVSGIASSINDPRIPLFVFCFAEELQKSFLPLFVAEYHSATDLFSKNVMQVVPISAFMFVIAVLTPFAGRLVDKFGNKKMFVCGIFPAVAGYLICFLAQNANEIVLGRSLTGVGYAVIILSCQSYIAKAITSEGRARGMAVFVGVLMAATMCGTAVGAILADWLGYKTVFLIAAVIAGLAGLLGWKMLNANIKKSTKPKNELSKPKSLFHPLFGNVEFILILILCAIPAKVILTGFLYLLVPISLSNLEASQSEIGRVMMLYSLVIIPISPIASRIVDQIGQNLWTVIFATIFSGVALFATYFGENLTMLISVVAALGFVHAFLKSPLIIAALEAAEKTPGVTETSALSFLRTSERIGSVIGPIIVGFLLIKFEFYQIVYSLGFAVSFLGVIMLFYALAKGDKIVRA